MFVLQNRTANPLIAAWGASRVVQFAASAGEGAGEEGGLWRRGRRGKRDAVMLRHANERGPAQVCIPKLFELAAAGVGGHVADLRRQSPVSPGRFLPP